MLLSRRQSVTVKILMSSHKKAVHHLSQAANNRTGWVEGLTDLTEDSPATALLDTMDKFGKLKMEQTELCKPEADLTPEEELKARIEYGVGLMQEQLRIKGEVMMEVGSPVMWGHVMDTSEKLQQALTALTAAADVCLADVTVLNEKTIEASTGKETCLLYVAMIVVRLRAGQRPPVEVRVAMIGNVDSGKSTMVGVLTRSVLDDGRGFARSKVFRHTHEESTGRTSSIGQHNLAVCPPYCIAIFNLSGLD